MVRITSSNEGAEEMILHQEYDDEDEDARVRAVFPGGVIASAEEFMYEQLNKELDRTIHVLVMRRYLSESGAMRWPWSQEARLSVKYECDFGR
jgi:hypothetical protein